VKQLLLFAVAGTIGFVVDAGVLVWVHALLGAYFGRLLSFFCAVITTWLINRSLTFRHQRDAKPLHREFSLYFLTTLGGGAVNLAGYSLLVYLFDLSVRGLPLAVAVGSLAGMLVNFWLSRRFVFTAGKEDAARDA
jgi:putative flippase GtrA